MSEKQEVDSNTWSERFADELYSYARWKIGDNEAARDLVQDTFLAAVRNLPNFRGDSSERTWLFAILKNKILDFYRSRYRKAPSESIHNTDDIQDPFKENGHWRQERMPHQWASKEVDALQQKEFFEVLGKCRDRLSGQQQLVFALKYIDDFDAEEICKELDITASNYWVILHRARVQLRECLEHNWINS
jgi:RNA polymerase sigma-70 factor (TIGR02943 family)